MHAQCYFSDVMQKLRDGWIMNPKYEDLGSGKFNVAGFKDLIQIWGNKAAIANLNLR